MTEPGVLADLAGVVRAGCYLTLVAVAVRYSAWRLLPVGALGVAFHLLYLAGSPAQTVVLTVLAVAICVVLADYARTDRRRRSLFPRGRRARGPAGRA